MIIFHILKISAYLKNFRGQCPRLWPCLFGGLFFLYRSVVTSNISNWITNVATVIKCLCKLHCLLGTKEQRLQFTLIWICSCYKQLYQITFTQSYLNRKGSHFDESRTWDISKYNTFWIVSRKVLYYTKGLWKLSLMNQQIRLIYMKSKPICGCGCFLFYCIVVFDICVIL